MKRFLVVLLLLVVGVVAFGFYQGWFTFSADEKKIREDVGKAEEKIKEAGEAIKEKTGIGGGDKIKKGDSKPEPPPK